MVKRYIIVAFVKLPFWLIILNAGLVPYAIMMFVINALVRKEAKYIAIVNFILILKTNFSIYTNYIIFKNELEFF